MIHTKEGLELATEQRNRMYRILGNLHAEIAPIHFRNYLLLAEGPIDEIRKLQREIDEYLGVTESAVVAGVRSE